MNKEVLMERITIMLMKADAKAEEELTAKEFKEYFLKEFSPALWNLLK